MLRCKDASGSIHTLASCALLISATMLCQLAALSAADCNSNIARDPNFLRGFDQSPGAQWETTAKSYDDGAEVLVTKQGHSSPRCPTVKAPEGPSGGPGTMAAIGTRENSTVRQYIQTVPGTTYSWSVLLFGDSYGSSPDSIFQMISTTRDNESAGTECEVRVDYAETNWSRIFCQFVSNASETLIKYRVHDRQCYLFFTDTVVKPAECPLPPNNAVADPITSEEGHLMPIVVGASLCGFLVLAGGACLCCWLFLRRRARRQGGKGSKGKSDVETGPSKVDATLKAQVKAYSYEELEAATEGFTDRLGGGGSGTVYRAVLDGEPLAVKRLKLPAERKTSEKEFLSEVQSLAQLRHVNLVSMRGYSAEVGKPKILVYDYIPGGTLKSLLHGTPAVPLTLQDRMRIAYGIARGMEYCHHLIPEPLMHRDLKPDNVLLTSRDARGIPKVADFGLAKIVKAEDRTQAPHAFPSQTPDRAAAPYEPVPRGGEASSSSSYSMSPLLFGSSPHPSTTNGSSSSSVSRVLERIPSITAVAGTAGYIDPEYFTSGVVTRKSDVYGFGMVLLELITRATPTYMYNLWVHESLADGAPVPEGKGQGIYAGWCQDLLNKGEEEIARLFGLTEGPREVTQCYEAIRIAHACLQGFGKNRPSMHEVVRMFEMSVGV